MQKLLLFLCSGGPAQEEPPSQNRGAGILPALSATGLAFCMSKRDARSLSDWQDPEAPHSASTLPLQACSRQCKRFVSGLHSRCTVDQNGSIKVIFPIECKTIKLHLSMMFSACEFGYIAAKCGLT